MTFGKPTTLPTILAAIAARAATALGINAAYVFPSLDLGELGDTGGPADTFAVLVSPRGRVIQEAVAGGGPDMLNVEASVTLELWNRVDVDQSYRDTQALQDLTIGILASWRKLLKRDTGLQLYAAVAQAGDSQSILTEPMRLIDWDLRPRSAKAGWVKHVSRWEIKYLEDTTT